MMYFLFVEIEYVAHLTLDRQLMHIQIIQT